MAERLEEKLSDIIDADPYMDDIDDKIDELTYYINEETVADKKFIMEYIYSEFTSSNNYMKICKGCNYFRMPSYSVYIKSVLIPLLNELTLVLKLDEDFLYEFEYENNISQPFIVLLSIIITEKINYICGLKEQLTNETIVFLTYYFNHTYNHSNYELIKRIFEQLENENDKKLFIKPILNVLFFRNNNDFIINLCKNKYITVHECNEHDFLRLVDLMISIVNKSTTHYDYCIGYLDELLANNNIVRYDCYTNMIKYARLLTKKHLLTKQRHESFIIFLQTNKNQYERNILLIRYYLILKNMYELPKDIMDNIHIFINELQKKDFDKFIMDVKSFEL